MAMFVCCIRHFALRAQNFNGVLFFAVKHFVAKYLIKYPMIVYFFSSMST